jgi:hypothetical protein
MEKDCTHCKVVVFPLAGEKGTCVDCGMTWTREEHKAALRREEIDQLKAGWASDPCFDIEDTEGFEDVREELLQFRKDTEAKWGELRMARLNKLAEMIGFRARELYEFGGKYSLDPLVFTEYMEKILGNISSLEDRLEQVEIKLDRIERDR